MTTIQKVLEEYASIREHLKTDLVHWCSSDTKFYSLNNFLQEVQKNPFSFYDFLLTSESFAWLVPAIKEHSFGHYLLSHAFATFSITVSFLLLLLFSILFVLLYFNVINQKRWEKLYERLWRNQSTSQVARLNCQRDTQEIQTTSPPARYLHSVQRGFHYIFFTKVSVFFFFFIAMLLVIFSVTSLPYMVWLYKSQSQFRCGALETFDAYFFGSDGIKSNNALIARDWKGSYTQLKQLKDLEFHLTFNKTFSIPKNFDLPFKKNEAQLNETESNVTKSNVTESNETSRNVSLCPMCYDVVKDFFSENGLVNVMETLGRDLKNKTHRMSLLYKYLTPMVSYINNQEVIYQHTDESENIIDYTFLFFQPTGFVLNNVTQLMYHDLEAKFDFLGNLASKAVFAQLLEGFSPTSPIFMESIYALNLGKDKILQIDSVIRKHYWKMRYIVHAVNKLMLILFILTFILSLICGGVGTFLLFHLIFACRDSSHLSRIRKRFNKIVFLFVLISCVTLFVSAIQYFLATIINDACRFSFTNLLHLGQWSDLPPKLLQADQKNIPDMESILDTCLKTGETGDIASTINARESINKVIQLTEAKIIKSKEEFSSKFKNFFNPIILNSFLYYSTNAYNFLTITPLFMHNTNIKKVHKLFPLYADDDINFVSFAKDIPENLYLVHLVNLAGQKIENAGTIYIHLNNRLSHIPVSIYTVLKKLNSLPAAYNVHNVSFCTTYMDKQKACSLKSPNTLHIGFTLLDNPDCSTNTRTDTNKITCASTTFFDTSNSTWASALSLFNDTNVRMNILRYAYILAVHDYVLRTPLILGDVVKYREENDSYFDHLDVDDSSRKNFFLLKYLKNFTCVMLKSDDDLKPNYCQLDELVNRWAKDLSLYSKEVSDSVKNIQSNFLRFHSLVENVMTSLMVKAKNLLDQSNCQVLGTATDIILKVSCSNLFTSSQTLTILYLIIGILSFLSAFFTLCIQRVES